MLGGRRDEHFRMRWEQVTDEVLEKLIVRPPGWPFSFASDLAEGGTQPDATLEHLRCYYPGGQSAGGRKQRCCVQWRQVFHPAPGLAMQMLASAASASFPGARRHPAGSVALGVMSGAVQGEKAARYLEFAANMTQACFQLYNTTASGLGAEIIAFDPTTGAVSVSHPRYWQVRGRLDTPWCLCGYGLSVGGAQHQPLPCPFLLPALAAPRGD